MEWHTRRSIAKNVSKRWARQYPTSKLETRKKLHNLGDSPNPDDVDAIIGNSSWTDTEKCNECQKDDNTPRLMIGETPDYESSTAYICLDCLKKSCSLPIPEDK